MAPRRFSSRQPYPAHWRQTTKGAPWTGAPS
jgi:hypothetical protein